MAAKRVAVATTSQLAAQAAAEVSELGGNAVDCGIAAAMSSINTQPGVCALAGSAFATIWLPGDTPVTIDGNVVIPGKGLPANFEPEAETVSLAYGGGIETIVGAPSVAVPGTLAALYLAAERYGRLPWHEILRPTIDAARRGFPLATACHYFLGFAGDVIYGRSDDGHRALHNGDGSLRSLHSTIVVPHLADTLAAIAEEGAGIFYQGELGQRIASHVCERGGMLTMADLQSYEPVVRDALMVDVGAWQIATNPPPAIGGANLAAMLLSFGTEAFAEWDQSALQRLVLAQEATMRYRRDRLDQASEVGGPVADMLALAARGELVSRWASAATVHTSAVDDAGMACSITASSGYGSGEMPAGTGLWLNNCLGELELNRLGLRAGPPGKRLPSNMAPAAARRANSVVAIGSPGADRITTALHQFLVNFLQRGLDLRDAVAHPRMHLKLDEPRPVIAIEPGLDVPDNGMGVMRFDDISMYFGGVAAARFDRDLGFDAAADPRREGGTFISTGTQGPDTRGL